MNTYRDCVTIIALNRIDLRIKLNEPKDQRTRRTKIVLDSIQNSLELLYNGYVM